MSKRKSASSAGPEEDAVFPEMAEPGAEDDEELDDEEIDDEELDEDLVESQVREQRRMESTGLCSFEFWFSSEVFVVKGRASTFLFTRRPTSP